MGTFGGILGATVIALTLVISTTIMGNLTGIIDFVSIFVFIASLGFAGTLLDSVLGATLQNKYYCTVCKNEIEENYHPSCNTTDLEKINGLTFLNNNTVNITTNLTMSLLSYVLIIKTNFKPF